MLGLAPSDKTATSLRQSTRQETDRHSYKSNLHHDLQLTRPIRMIFSRLKLLKFLGNSWKRDFLMCPKIQHTFCSIEFPRAVEKRMTIKFSPSLEITIMHISAQGNYRKFGCSRCLAPGCTGPTVFQNCQLTVNLNHFILGVCKFVCV